MGTQEWIPGKIEEGMLESIELHSKNIKRTVQIDFYESANVNPSAECDLLLMNDGQDLVKMNFGDLFKSLYETNPMKPVIVAGIHCGPDRKNEYGMSAGPDYKGSGAKAKSYEKFIIKELLPFIKNRFKYLNIAETSFAGFSLGALSAFDIAWNNPDVFSLAGVFSASLWWRTIDKDDKTYNPWTHRMMHKQVAAGEFRKGMKFFFECGEHDEEEDRNRNGVIDSIDDTLDLMRLLIKKGYREGKDIYYLQLPDGKHDVPSWAKALPTFMLWAWGRARFSD
jgi:enterochelin esterase-like enzyme